MKQPNKTFLPFFVVGAVLFGCSDTDGGASWLRRPSSGLAPSFEATESTRAKKIVSALRTRFSLPGSNRTPALPAGIAEYFERVPEGLRPYFAGSREKPSAKVTLPRRVTDPVRLEDETSGTRVEVTLLEARESEAEAAEGYVVYPGAHVSGATVLQRPLLSGVEDYLSFDDRPRTPSVAYRLALGAGAIGLRLVANTLEVLDIHGAPRLRVAPPYLIGADGERTVAALAVEGCAVDTNPAAPWGRAVTPPGGTACTVRVAWTDHSVAYPALLDPRWETTREMAVARYEHTATRLANDNVLVVGGRSDTSLQGLPRADLFNPQTRTWSPAGSPAARRLHSATLLSNGKVLIAGGLTATTPSPPAQPALQLVNSWQLYDPAAGSWSTAPTSSQLARHSHTATFLSNGNVFIAGGMNLGADNNTPTVLNTTAIYTPPSSSGNGSWNSGSTMTDERVGHTATLLTSGNTAYNNRVLIVGGFDGAETLRSIDIFNGSSRQTSTPALPLNTARRQGHTATRLSGGNVVVAGGRSISPNSGTTFPGDSIVFEIPASGTASWQPPEQRKSMGSPRELHTATLLPSGQLLLAGGSSNGSNVIPGTELGDGAANWSSAGALHVPARGHSATLVGNVVFLIGGLGGDTAAPLNALQPYDSSFGVACTSNSQCATGFCVDSVCCESACNDGNACNGRETCNTGTCTAGTPITVDDSNPCTTDTCNTATGAVAHNALPNGTGCEEGDLCTVLDTCQAGTCVDGPPNTCAPVNPCRTAGVCNPATGACTIVPAPGNPTCDDGNPCTVGDHCLGDTCAPGEATACTAEEYLPPITEIDVAGGLATDAVDINNDGDVAGIDWGTWHTGYTSRAFRVDGTTGLTTLPSDQGPLATTSQAFGISPDGTLVGQTVYAFGYTKAGVLNTYPELWYSSIRSMNAAGQFTGHSYVSGYTHGPGAYRYTPATPPVIEFIGPVSTAFTGASANAIDDDGRVVGRLGTETYPPGMENIWGTNGRAFSWTGPNALQNLNDLLPVNSGWTLLGAADVTSADPLVFDDGFIVGYGILNGELRGFRLRDDGTIDEAKPGPFVQSHDDTFLMGVNRHGDAVGYAAVAGNYFHRALLFTRDGETHDLNDFVDEQEWLLEVATAINDNGELVGYGTRFPGTPNARKRGFKMALGSILATPQRALRPIVQGVVDEGNGRFVAVFAYGSSAAQEVDAPLDEQTHFVSINGTRLANPQPAPPTRFQPNTELDGETIYHGAFLPTFNAGQSITWTLGGRPVTASGSSPRLTKVPLGTGYRVQVGPNDWVTVRADRSAYLSRPSEPSAPQAPEFTEKFNGTLAGSLSVSPSGGAVYSLPISIPPGIGGMAPNLALAYNSQGGNGLAGQGWELTGLSMIYRCPKTRVHDGHARPVMSDFITNVLDPEDVDGLCLDGERLWEIPAGSGVFRREHDDFSTIRRQPNGSYVVVTKSGEVRHYGTTAITRIGTYNLLLGLKVARDTVAWALDKVVDTWGNYYDLHYNNGDTDFLSAGVKLTSIAYTGNLRTGAQPFATITFQYEERNDVRRARFGPWTIPRPSRLKSIATPVGIYSLAYAPDDPLLPSRLTEIKYCALANDPSGMPQCKTPLEFGWDWQELGWEAGPLLPGQVNYNGNAAGERFQPGTQLVDLDGDGRLDFAKYKTTAPPATWRNTGSAFVPANEWNVPEPLADPNAKRAAVFADIDGDGMSDLVVGSDSYETDCSVSNWIYEDEYCKTVGVGTSPVVYFNRIRDGGGWERSPGYARPAGFDRVNFGTTDTMSDVDGDGRADLVRMGFGLEILHNTGSGWERLDQGSAPTFLTYKTFISKSHLEDVNRDGMLDVVADESSGSGAERGYKVLLNTGHWSQNRGDFGTHSVDGPNGLPAPVQNHRSMWKTTTILAPTGDEHDVASPFFHMGDIDGDGTFDSYIERTNRDTSPPSADWRIQFGHSGTYVSGLEATGFLAAVSTPAVSSFLSGLVDLNADGLADLVFGGTESTGTTDPANFACLPYVNTGTTWTDLGVSRPGNRAPFAPRNDNLHSGVMFVDLNGDGVTDALKAQVSNTGEAKFETWLNKFEPPVIKHFPNGLAAPSELSYVVISSAEAADTYSDSDELAPNTRYTTAPLRVVASIAADNGVGGTLTSTYRYGDLRDSRSGLGTQGFGFVVVTDPSGTTTTTTFAQSYPYTGAPTSVTVENHGLLSKTETEYCDRYDASIENPCLPLGYTLGRAYGAFIYPRKVTTTTYLRTETIPEPEASEKLVTTSEFEYDESGNAITTTVTNRGPSDGYRKTIVNAYGDPGSSMRARGKVTRATIISERMLSGVGIGRIERTTEFQYRDLPQADPLLTAVPQRGVALIKTIVEPLGDPAKGLQTQTAQEYDDYGNVVTTTVCASDFTSCMPGASGPIELPFRTTKVSYDPAHSNLSPPEIAALGYGPGRFPVRTTDATNVSSYAQYDPLFGVPTMQTAPNGVRACHEYDAFGRRTISTDRCGSTMPATTTVRQYVVTSGTPDGARVVTVTEPPDGATGWEFSDALGRKIGSMARGFDGRFVESTTVYDSLGRVQAVSKPKFQDDNGPNSTFWTRTVYDDLGRVWKTSEDLGDIDSSGFYPVDEVTRIYAGSTITMQRSLPRVLRERSETKNALGKLTSVTDENGGVISYFYNAEGALTDTTDAVGNTIHRDYDLRGRERYSNDPDMGESIVSYNGYGEVVERTDAKGQVVKLSYDVLGRITAEEERAGESSRTAYWLYHHQGSGVGQLAAFVSAPDSAFDGGCPLPGGLPSLDGERHVRTFSYGAVGELRDTTDCVDGKTFLTSYGYDTMGRQNSVTYPEVANSRLTAEYHFTRFGYLHYVSDQATQHLFWAATAMDAAGHVTKEYTRNGVETVETRNPATGWLMNSTSTAHADRGTSIQNRAYRYDRIGNLRARFSSDDVHPADSQEVFTYDPLNRLKTSELTLGSGSPTLESFEYDGIGNLTRKNGRDYTYTGCLAGNNRAAGPHAVCLVENDAYVYDANGNLSTGGGRTLEYNVSDKPTHIGMGADFANFIYDANGNRVVQSLGSGEVESARTIYVGMGATGKSLYERTAKGGSVEHAQFIYAGGHHGGSAIALRLVTTGSTETPTETMRFYHFDHLGSVVATSDGIGRVADSAWTADEAPLVDYDAWGSQRNARGEPLDQLSTESVPGRRGFTGHESIRNVGLVNMNGRVYDPVLGRFVTPDPSIQFPGDLQSYNRYSYVHNNPLRYTDPTGYRFFRASNYQLIQIGLGITAAVACPFTAGATCGIAVGLVSAGLYAGSVYHRTGDVGQSLGAFGSSFGIGIMSGSLAGGGAGQSPQEAMLRGAISGTISTTFNQILERDFDALDILTSAAEGAVMAGMSAAVAPTNPVAEASAQQASVDEGEMVESVLGANDLGEWSQEKSVVFEESGGPRTELAALHDPLGVPVDPNELGKSPGFGKVIRWLRNSVLGTYLNWRLGKTVVEDGALQRQSAKAAIERKIKKAKPPKRIKIPKARSVGPAWIIQELIIDYIEERVDPKGYERRAWERACAEGTCA